MSFQSGKNLIPRYSVWVHNEKYPRHSNISFDQARSCARYLAHREKVHAEVLEGWDTTLMDRVYFDGRNLQADHSDTDAGITLEEENQ